MTTRSELGIGSSEDSSLKLPEMHVISVEEFISPFEGDLLRNTALGRVNRANFLSTMKSSFAISRGSPPAQYLLFEWMELNHGFDYKTTFKNFLEAGGAEALSKKEKEQFITDYLVIKGHHEHNIWDTGSVYSDRSILDGLNDTAKEFLVPSDSFILMVPRDTLQGISRAEIIGIVNDTFET